MKNGSKGLMMIGSLRKTGVTTYMRQGKMVVRTSHSDEKRSNTLPQFIQRQRVRHAVALWKMLRFGCKTLLFTQRPTAYNNFILLATRLPVVFMPDVGFMSKATFLMPGIPVSDGTLPPISLELGEVDGTPALLTDIADDRWVYDKKWLFYTAEQTIEGEDMPRVRFKMREVTRHEMVDVDGRLAMVGGEFSDEMKGWALVQVNEGRCSAQSIVTRCTLYQRYTTEEALFAAAESYGGLTEKL